LAVAGPAAGVQSGAASISRCSLSAVPPAASQSETSLPVGSRTIRTDVAMPRRGRCKGRKAVTTARTVQPVMTPAARCRFILSSSVRFTKAAAPLAARFGLQGFCRVASLGRQFVAPAREPRVGTAACPNRRWVLPRAAPLRYFPPPARDIQSPSKFYSEPPPPRLGPFRGRPLGSFPPAVRAFLAGQSM
jgi:hypothetical protein